MEWKETQTRQVGPSAPTSRVVGSLTGRVISDFTVSEPIGQGGSGMVYRARQKALDRDVVIKVLRHVVETGDHDSRSRRFLREAQLASGLDHPYAAHIYDFGVEPDGVMWIAMEMVHGTPLSRIIRAQGALPLARFLPLLEKICEVVHTAHERGIVHRDIKPANVMVISRAGRLLPKLLDFGIARHRASPDETPAALDIRTALGADDDQPRDDGATRELLGKVGEHDYTPEGVSLGSPTYMAPEQWRDAANVDARADQYALGVMTYEALTGRMPFKAGNLNVLSQAHASTPPPSLGPRFSADLDAVVRRSLAKDPDQRFPDVMAFVRALRAVAPLENDGQAVVALNQDLMHLYLSQAPQPIADTIASLEAANALRKAALAAAQIIGVSLNYLGVLALGAACRLDVAFDESDAQVAAALAVIKRLYTERLSSTDWLTLIRGLVRPFADRPDAHPVPELVLLFTAAHPSGEAAHMTGLAARDRGIAVNQGRSLEEVRQMVPDIEWFLERISFVCEYPLVAVTHGRVESWVGARRAMHPLHILHGSYQPEDGDVLLTGADGAPVLILTPFAQRLEPAPRNPPELFLLAGGGRYGALVTAFPTAFDRYIQDIWPWLETRMSALAADQATVSETQVGREAAPYMGLSPFSRADAARYFGREREVEACVNRLRIEPFLAIVGPSGAGKSSFVQAGILPTLKDSWQAVVTRPGASPIVALATSLGELELPSTGIALRMRRDPDALREVLVEYCRERGSIVVLVIDQFEELVTLCPDDELRRRYAESLMRAALDPDGPVRVIITLRDDFLLRVQRIAPLSERLSSSLHLLATPPPEQLERILVEPARRAGYEFDDPTLPHEMVDAVAAEPSALALLSFTASKLWEQRDRQFRRLSRRVYRELGGVGGALAQHAEGILDDMSDDERKLVRELFRQLVTADGTRAILTRRELEQILGQDERAEGVLERLISARLLVASENLSTAAGREAEVEAEDARLEDHIEVVHEALLSSWPRLVSWQREDAENARLRDQIRAAARQWHERDRPKGLLWRDDALLEYRVWRARYRGSLTDDEEAFIAASLREDARGRFLRRALALSAFLIMAVVVLVVMVLNRDLSSERDRSDALAEKASLLARQSRDLLVDLQREQGRRALLEGQPMHAFVYLREALDSRVAKGVDSRGDDDPTLRFMLGRAVDALAGEERVLTGHEGNVLVVRFAPDGKYLASGGDDGKARIWDVESGALERVLTGHTDKIWALDFDPSGTRLVTASWDDTARLWDVRTGQSLTMARHEDSVMDVAFSDQGQVFVTAGKDGAVQIWHPLERRLVRTVVEDGPVQSVAIDDQARYLVTGSTDRIARLRRVSDGALLAATESHGDTVSDVVFSPDGTRAASVSWSGVAHLFVIDPGGAQASVRPMDSHGAGIASAAFSPDGRFLATAGVDDTARLWNPETGQLVRTVHAHPGGVSRVLFSADGARLYTAGYDGLARVFTVASGSPGFTFIGHRDVVWSADLAPDGSRLATGSLDGTVRLWNARQTHQQLVLPRGTETVMHALVDPRGTMLATVDATGKVQVWNRDSQMKLDATRSSPALEMTMPVADRVSAKWLSWSPDGNRLLGSGGLAAIEWDVYTGDRMRIIDGREAGRVRHAIHSPSGRAIASAHDSGAILVRDARTGEILHKLDGHDGPVVFLDYSADGDRLLSVGSDKRVLFWDPVAGTREPVHIDHRQVINSARFNPDASLVAIASQDKSVPIHSTRDGALVRALEGHNNETYNAVFSPDGALIATASDDRMIHVWDVRSGTVLWSVGPRSVGARSIAFSPRGDALIGSFDRSVEEWNVAYEERSIAELDAAFRCRIDYVLESGRLQRQPLSPCAPRSRAP